MRALNSRVGLRCYPDGDIAAGAVIFGPDTSECDLCGRALLAIFNELTGLGSLTIPRQAWSTWLDIRPILTDEFSDYSGLCEVYLINWRRTVFGYFRTAGAFTRQRQSDEKHAKSEALVRDYDRGLTPRWSQRPLPLEFSD